MGLKLVQIAITFLVLFTLNLITPRSIGGFANLTERMWVLSMAVLGVTAIFIIAKNWSFKLPHLAIGGILGLLVWNPVGSAMTIFCYYAAVLVFSKSSLEITAFRGPRRRIWQSAVIGLAIGVPLAALNVQSALSAGMQANIGNPLSAAFLALRPGVSEEVIFRFFVYALCVYAAKGRLATTGLRLLAFLLIIVPHVLLHLPEQFLINPLNGVISAIFMSLLFGLPMALLQLKRGLEAAIALHWFVDFIRFFILGS